MDHARIVTQQLEQMRGELNQFATGLRGRSSPPGGYHRGGRISSGSSGRLSFGPSQYRHRPAGAPNWGSCQRSRKASRTSYCRGPSRPCLATRNFSFCGRPPGSGRAASSCARRTLANRLSRSPRSRLHRLWRRKHPPGIFGLSCGSRRPPTEPARPPQRVRSICRLVESGIGLAVLPETAARRCQRSMAIRVIPLTDAWAARHFTICCRNFRSLPAHAQRFVEYLSRPRSRAP